jgi:hypothetical protein
MMLSDGHQEAMDETAFKATGLVALPLMPPYVVRLLEPTAGHASPSAFRCINEEIVLIAVTPSAPPST